MQQASLRLRIAILAQTSYIAWCLLFTPREGTAGSGHSGYVIGWGCNLAGQATGIPSVVDTNADHLAPGAGCGTGAVSVASQLLSNAIAISAYQDFSLALRDDGTVAGWGSDSLGEAVGQPAPYPGITNGVVSLGGKVLTNVGAIACGEGFGMALRKNGTVVAWGSNALDLSLSGIVSIAAGAYDAAYAVRRDGTVWSWRGKTSGLGSGMVSTEPGLSNVVALAVGKWMHGPHVVALRNNGTVAVLGRKEDKYYAPPEGLSNVAAVAASGSHTLALKKNGTVFGWGSNEYGQSTGVPTTSSANHDEFCAGQIRLEGSVLSNVVAIAANNGYSMALKSDGTVLSWGRLLNGYYLATVPKGLSNIVAIAAGETYSLAITTNRAVADRFSH